MIEKKIKIGNLSDFYGELLTDNQKIILQQYIDEDLSLGEIASNQGISRQAVYDSLKRSEKLLDDFEEKLGLFEKFEIHKKELTEIHKELNSINLKIQDKDLKKEVQDIEGRINNLIY